MAVTQYKSGTKLVSTTEWSMVNDSSSIATDTTAAVFMLVLDLNALAAGDLFTCKLYEKTRSGDTQRVIQTWNLTGVQADPIWVSPAVMLMQGWDFTLLKVAGTDRTILWSLRQV